MQGRFESFVGEAADTFPLCLTTPWFNLFDLLIANTQSNSYIGYTVEVFGSSTTFNLSAAPDTFATIGLEGPYNMIIEFLQGVGWLTFGWFIFRDVFWKGHNEHE